MGSLRGVPNNNTDGVILKSPPGYDVRSGHCPCVHWWVRQASLNPRSWFKLSTWLHVPNSQASKDSTCSETSPTSPAPGIIWKLLIKVRWKKIIRINIKNNCVPFSTLRKGTRTDFQELCVFGISPAYLQKASEATVIKSTSTETNDSSPWESVYGIL